MIKERRRHIDDNKVKEVKRLVSQGVGIREAGRLAKISYYAAWHIVKGSYDNDKRLADVFKKEDGKYFTWSTFKTY